MLVSVSLSKLPVGSSAISISESCESARAIPTRCCLPYLQQFADEHAEEIIASTSSTTEIFADKGVRSYFQLGEEDIYYDTNLNPVNINGEPVQGTWVYSLGDFETGVYRTIIVGDQNQYINTYFIDYSWIHANDEVPSEEYLVSPGWYQYPRYDILEFVDKKYNGVLYHSVEHYYPIKTTSVYYKTVDGCSVALEGELPKSVVACGENADISQANNSYNDFKLWLSDMGLNPNDLSLYGSSFWWEYASPMMDEAYPY